MFLVIVLILFGVFGFWGQTLGKATILPKREAKQPTKHFGAKAEISQVHLRRVASASTIFAAIRCVIANGYRELSRDTKSIIRDFGDLIKCTVTVIENLKITVI